MTKMPKSSLIGRFIITATAEIPQRIMKSLNRKKSFMRLRLNIFFLIAKTEAQREDIR